MMNNLRQKISNVIIKTFIILIIFGVDEYIINYLFANEKYYIINAFVLLYILIMWFKFNTNKKTLLFYIGVVYITIPMLYFCFNKQDIEILSMFFWLVFIYNIFNFILFKIIGGLQIKMDRNKLELIINTISALLVSMYKLNLGFPDTGYFTILKDYKIATTIFFTIILLVSDFILTKIKPLIESKSMIELRTTESIFPTCGIFIKIANSFFFISYIYIIYVIVLKILYILTK